MGVEYSHGIFIRDLEWRPTWQHVEAVVAVLQKWGFAADIDYVVDDEPIDEMAARSMPNNLLVSVRGPEGAAAAKIMGPSIYKKLADDDRYIIQADLYLGSDYKVLALVEGDEIEVTTPPMEDGVAIEPAEDAYPLPFVNLLYPASWNATTPTTSVSEGFSRIWRCGLILDCNKDVPAIAEPMSNLPATGFVRDLEAAFGTKLVELGWYH